MQENYYKLNQKRSLAYKFSMLTGQETEVTYFTASKTDMG